MKRLVVLLAGFLLAFVCTAVVASPASATIRFCKFSKTNHTCVGYINGCTLRPGDGQFIFAEDGDKIVNGAGITMTCRNGKWVREMRIPPQTFEVVLGESISLQIAFEGESDPLPPPPKLTPDYLCGRNIYFCTVFVP